MKERQSIEEEEDMESRPTGVVVICIVVGLLGLVSAAAGFGAEATRIKGSEVELVSPTQCAYPQSAAALGMGLTSVASLLLAHIILNLVTGCFCCCCCSSYNNNYIIITKTTTSNTSSSAIAILCFILSWLTFIAALFLLLTAAVLNERHGEDTKYNGNYYCYIVKPGVFAAGALLSLTSVLLGILFFYYLTAPPPPPPFSPPNHQPPAAAAAAAAAIAIGGRSMAVARPPPPPPRDRDVTDRPVFVHQDTYMRRHFP